MIEGESLIYDTLIIGGGPAGLAASIYLGRFLRTNLVIDSNTGRTTHYQTNKNYPGFPGGIPAIELSERMLEQAISFGGVFARDSISSVHENDKRVFVARGSSGSLYYGRSLIYAAGVEDQYPAFEGVEDYIGKSLFWCITCDGFEVQGKRVVVIGKNDSAATTALQFLRFTPHVEFLTNCSGDLCELSDKKREQLSRSSIEVHEDVIAGVKGTQGFMETVTLMNGTQIAVDFMFNQREAKPNSELLRSFPVAFDNKGYVLIDKEQRVLSRTGEPITLLYAAGDVTRDYSHQIASAVHEGSMAAQAANYDLYPLELRE